MDYGDLYLSDGKNIYSVWDGSNLEQWIEQCIDKELEVSKSNHK